MRGGALRDDRWPTEGPAAMALDALDGLLEDAATALRHLETWRRFAAHQARSVLREASSGRRRALNAAAAELGEWYAVLECRLCLAALRAAETLDTSADVVASLVRDDVDVFGDAAAAATVAHGSSADDALGRAPVRGAGALVGPRGRGGQRRGLCVRPPGARDAARPRGRGASTGSRARARSSRPTRASGARWRAGRPTRL